MPLVRSKSNGESLLVAVPTSANEVGKSCVSNSQVEVGVSSIEAPKSHVVEAGASSSESPKPNPVRLPKVSPSGGVFMPSTTNKKTGAKHASRTKGTPKGSQFNQPKDGVKSTPSKSQRSRSAHETKTGRAPSARRLQGRALFTALDQDAWVKHLFEKEQEPTAYQSYRSETSNVSSQSNLKFKTIKYFDSSAAEATPYQQFQFDLFNNSPFKATDAAAGSSAACRVHTAKFYVLPRWSSDSSASSSMVLFSVPAFTSVGYDTSTPPSLTSVSQRSTFVQPMIDTHWIKVGEYNVNAFSTSDLRPASWENGMLCLGSWCTADPDTGAATWTSPLQMKVEIIYEITVPPVLSVQGALVTSAIPLFSDFVDKVAAEALPAYGEPISVTRTEI